MLYINFSGVLKISKFLFKFQMALVGQSLEVLRRLGRFVTDQSQVNSYQKLINSINSKIAILGKVTPVCSKQTTLKSREKKRSIFTMNTGNLLLSRDNGKGDCSGIGSLLEELGEGKKIVQQKEVNNYYDDRCLDFVYSAIKNSFFKKAFENVGLRYQIKRLEEAKAAKSDEGELGLMVVKYVYSKNNTFSSINF